MKRANYKIWVPGAALRLLALVVAVASATNADAAMYTITDLGSLGAPLSTTTYVTAPAAINDLGQVVGDSFTASGADHAFLYLGGQMLDLGTLPGDQNVSSRATAINNSGQKIKGRKSKGSGVFDGPEPLAAAGMPGGLQFQLLGCSLFPLFVSIGPTSLDA